MAIFNTVYGGEGKWKPGANTLAYYKLETNADDFSGNSRNGTGNSMSYITDGTMQVANFNGGYITLPTVGALTNVTVSLWVKSTQTTSGEFPMVFLAPTSDNKNLSFALNSGLAYAYRWNGSTAASINSGISIADGQWHNITLTLNSTTQTLYVDGVSKSSGACSYAIEWGGMSGLGKNINNAGSPTYRGYMSRVIIEGVAWTSQQIAKYYNQTKSNYGL